MQPALSPRHPRSEGGKRGPRAERRAHRREGRAGKDARERVNKPKLVGELAPITAGATAKSNRRTKGTGIRRVSYPSGGVYGNTESTHAAISS